MRLRGLAVVAGLFLLASPASAHLVTSGLGPFYDGSLHLLLSPTDLLGLLAITLLAGLRGPEAGRWTVLLLPSAWFIAGLIGLYAGTDLELTWTSTLFLLVMGLLVALDAKLPTFAVAALAAAFGTVQGLVNGSALVELGAGPTALLGIAGSAFVLVVLIAAAVVALRPTWTRIAVRALGSWVAAVGLLMIGWLSQAPS